jgi:Uma2 family endonuclease
MTIDWGDINFLGSGFMAVGTIQKEKKRLWTFDQLLAEMPESNQPTELWDGELLTTPSPTPVHQAIIRRLANTISEFVYQRGLGEVFFAPLDVVFTQRRVTQPDILFVSTARRAIIQDRVRGAPDLIIEVISPGTWRRDHVDKRTIYEQFGVSEYWIVDPEAEMIEVLALEEGMYRLAGRYRRGETAQSKLLDGFSAAVDAVLG